MKLIIIIVSIVHVFYAKHGSDVSPKFVIPHHTGKVMWPSITQSRQNSIKHMRPCCFDLKLQKNFKERMYFLSLTALLLALSSTWNIKGNTVSLL